MDRCKWYIPTTSLVPPARLLLPRCRSTRPLRCAVDIPPISPTPPGFPQTRPRGTSATPMAVWKYLKYIGRGVVKSTWTACWVELENKEQRTECGIYGSELAKSGAQIMPQENDNSEDTTAEARVGPVVICIGGCHLGRRGLRGVVTRERKGAGARGS